MNIYDEITKKFKNGDKIPLLTKGRFDTYIGTTSTKVYGILYEKAILFEISAINKKCITSKFIELTYDYFIKNNYTFPTRDWYRNHDLLKHENKSRPCNYSVVQGLIKVTLDTKTT
jgi:hypothetical protein